ncbi:uncharacterized protein LOC119080913 [Bradysia coprophila]|uniref:uncharacterized protein LOC119080913 n=1 Tax=Bradysia coprophila TaxID=38358 RepID=UPI00187D98E1|nr:uncharacterized protein LOC119080913 [Bradysia coprophila]XP_037045416.1 uncharacterized protein LOC119080913 [Bradysia coprophila]XP_037045417.1 uncharacterized protein LOC119080913 [Bradysia coprophila]XP_037045418.1 uncharacterized protein LOC119080913 [Bradysia coprophila]XP_037045419.1 uncharacterized protein LOC119080913 [Bradysia coprophila]
MFSTDYAMMLLLLSLCIMSSSSARLLQHRHHRHHSNVSHHVHTRHNSSQHIVHRTVPIRSTGEPLKLTLVNAYPNGFFNPHFNRRWNANENEQRDVEINWNREPTAVTSTAKTTTTLSTTTMRSLRDRSYTKHNAIGRNVCGDQRTVTTSVNTNDMRQPCLNSAVCNNGFGYPGIKHRVTKQYIHNCCPGWAQVSKSSHGCTKPICKQPCKNGGKCVKPDICSCSSGFSGRYCELDINECLEEKPCDQACYNTLGSYYCKCRDGFQLMGDKQSCRKLNAGDDSAFEAKDLENEVDYEQLTLKISKIEKLIETEQEMNYELQKKIQTSAATMNQLKIRIDNMDQRQHEMNYIKDRVNSLNYLVDVLYKCRTQSSIFCPLQS